MNSEKRGNLGIAEIIGDKRAAILELAARHGASQVRVFGSVARGEARPDSDVDFLVDFKAGSSIFDQIGLWQDLGELLNRKVDLATDKTFKKWIKPRALRDAVIL